MSAIATPIPAGGTRSLQRSLARAERVRKLRAFALTLPLLVFLMLTFLVPIAALLKRAIENPEVANTLPRTASALERWNRRDAPPDEAYAAVLADLGALPDSADAGALARRLNSEVPGARSLVMNAYKALPLEGAATPGQAKTRLIALDERWADMKYWQAIAKNASRWTGDYLLASVDLKRDAQGTIERMAPDQRVFGRIL